MSRVLLFLSTAVGGALMFTAQTPYEDARSNLESWFRAAGLSDVSIPAAADQWGFYAGLYLFAFGLGAIAWGYFRPRRVGRWHESKEPPQLATPVPAVEPHSPSTQERSATISMDEAVHLLMDRVGYEALTGPAFRAFLREGRITAFGKPIVGAWDPSSGHKLGTEVQIPAVYWEDAEPQWTSHRVSAKTRHLGGGLEYGRVRFSRDDVMRCYFGGAPPMSRE